MNSALSLSMVRLSEVEWCPVKWLWPRHLAVGKLHCFYGGGRVGKTMMAIDPAATATTGRPWPDESPGCASGAVAYMTAEDGLEDTILPRFQAAGGDTSRMFVLNTMLKSNGSAKHFNLADPECMNRCEAALREISDLRLFILDPVTAFLGRADSHKIGDVRTALLPLAEMAERLSIAVLFIHHVNKASSKRAVHRASGSTAFIDAVRIAFMVDGDPSTPDGAFIFQVVKSNIEEKPPCLDYRICAVPEYDTAKVEWFVSEESVEEAQPIEQLTPLKPEKKSVIFLRNALAGGERPMTDVLADGEAAGFSKKEIRTAREHLGIQPRKAGFGKDGKYFRCIPNDT